MDKRTCKYLNQIQTQNQNKQVQLFKKQCKQAAIMIK